MNQRTLPIDVYKKLVNIIGACEDQEIELRNLGPMGHFAFISSG